MNGRLRTVFQRILHELRKRTAEIIPKTFGVNETLVSRFRNAIIAFYSAFFPWAIAYILIYAANTWDLPAEVGIVMFALVVFGATSVMMVWVPVGALYRAVKFTLTEFTPPYREGIIEFERPGDRSGYIEWEDPAQKAMSATHLYFLLMVGWFVALRIWLEAVDEPHQWINSVVNSIPDVLIDVVVNSITNYTSIDIRTLLGQIQDPAVVILNLLVIGALVFFIGIGTWNMVYGIRLWAEEKFD